MAKIKIQKTFTLPVEEVRAGLEKIGQGLKDEHGLNYQWVNDKRVEFTHKSVKGFVDINDNDIVLQLKLGMLYAAMAPVVKKRIAEMADKYIS